MKTRSLRVLVGAVAVSVSLLGSLSPAQAQVLPNPTAPALRLYADCVVRTKFSETVWFGFRNEFTSPLHLDVGADNAIAVGGVDLGNAGQVTQFLVGETRRAFAVSITRRSSATWKVMSPFYNRQTGLMYPNPVPVAVSSVGAPLCAAGVPGVSATAQITEFSRRPLDSNYYPNAKPTVVSLLDRKDASGKLAEAFVGFSLDKVRSACSAGTPLDPAILWGFGGPTNRTERFYVAGPTTTAGYRPPLDVVRTDTGSGYAFARTYYGVRRVDAPQALTPFIGDAAVVANYPKPKGLSSEKVIADVFGRCLLSDGQVVTSVNPLWIDSSGEPFHLFTTTDEATQRTRAAVLCGPAGTTPPGPLLGCDVRLAGDGPGVQKYR
jgi:hypothetical protein